MGSIALFDFIPGKNEIISFVISYRECAGAEAKARSVHEREEARAK